MANINAPKGLILAQGSAGITKLTKVFFDAADGTATFPGDALKLDQTNGGDAEGTPAMVQIALTNEISGVLVGVDVEDSATSDKKYRVASADKYGFAVVLGIKDAVFEIQEDSDGGALTADDVGKMVDVVLGTGDTTTGKSGMMIDSSSASATDGQLTLIRPVQTTENALGNYCVWEVQINEASFR